MNMLFLGHPDESELALFAGGELGPLGRWRIERHLQHCQGCQDAVSDFFHLQSELSELVQTPPVDWKALGHNIAVRVRQQDSKQAEASQRWLTHPRVWQVGLAATALLCTIVVVRQFPTVRQGIAEPAPQQAAQSQFLDKADSTAAKAIGGYAKQADAEAPGVAEESKAEKSTANEPAQAAGEESGRANLTRESRGMPVSGQAENAAAAPRDRLDSDLAYRGPGRKEMAPDIEAQTAPSAEPRSQPAATEVAADSATDRRQRLASAAPPPQSPIGAANLRADEKETIGALAELRQVAPASPAPGPAVAAEADSGALQDQVGSLRAIEKAGARRKTEPFKVAQAAKAISAPVQALRAAENRLEKKASAEAISASERGFTVLPAALEDPTVDVGVAADGWISVRSLDANTGTITITDVYVP